jgi:hypothetical protein
MPQGGAGKDGLPECRLPEQVPVVVASTQIA